MYKTKQGGKSHLFFLTGFIKTQVALATAETGVRFPTCRKKLINPQKLAPCNSGSVITSSLKDRKQPG